MEPTWIVAANAGRARFFSRTRATDTPEEINDMVNTAARLRTGELETDRMGQRSASKSRHSVGAPTQPSGYEPDQSPAQHLTEIFARDVADFLLKGHQQGRFRQLFLIASPEFLGVLRSELDPQLKSAVTLEINRDYTQSSASELHERLRTHEAKS